MGRSRGIVFVMRKNAIGAIHRHVGVGHEGSWERMVDNSLPVQGEIERAKPAPKSVCETLRKVSSNIGMRWT